MNDWIKEIVYEVLVYETYNIIEHVLIYVVTEYWSLRLSSRFDLQT